MTSKPSYAAITAINLVNDNSSRKASIAVHNKISEPLLNVAFNETQPMDYVDFAPGLDDSQINLNINQIQQHFNNQIIGKLFNNFYLKDLVFLLSLSLSYFNKFGQL